jgi:geranylgeranyl reductase family protein
MLSLAQLMLLSPHKTMNHNSYDVAIIGAGPAGCSAGIMLAKNGVKVLLLDKSEFPRDKPCGGLLTEKTYSIISKTLGLKGLNNVILQKSDSFEIYDGKRFINIAGTSSSTYYVSRKSFDNFLLEGARQAGCFVLTGTSISNLESSCVSVGMEHYKFEYLVGADGLNSMVRRHCGIFMPKDNIAVGLQVDVPLNKLQPNLKSDLPRIYFGYVKYGWGWAFPKGNYLSLGLAGLFPRGTNIKQAFNFFLTELSCLEAAKESQIRVAQIPYGSYLSSPGKNNVLLIGDAAGFVDPVTGEGIYNAILSGAIAADVLSNDVHTNKAEEHRNQCRIKIINPLRQGMMARWFLFEEPFHSLAMKKFHGNAKHMKLFMRVLAGDVDYIDYFYETIKRKFRPN